MDANFYHTPWEQTCLSSSVTHVGGEAEQPDPRRRRRQVDKMFLVALGAPGSSVVSVPWCVTELHGEGRTSFSSWQMLHSTAWVSLSLSTSTDISWKHSAQLVLTGPGASLPDLGSRVVRKVGGEVKEETRRRRIKWPRLETFFLTEADQRALYFPISRHESSSSFIHTDFTQHYLNFFFFFFFRGWRVFEKQLLPTEGSLLTARELPRPAGERGVQRAASNQHHTSHALGHFTVLRLLIFTLLNRFQPVILTTSQQNNLNNNTGLNPHGVA